MTEAELRVIITAQDRAERDLKRAQEALKNLGVSAEEANGVIAKAFQEGGDARKLRQGENALKRFGLSADEATQALAGAGVQSAKAKVAVEGTGEASREAAGGLRELHGATQGIGEKFGSFAQQIILANLAMRAIDAVTGSVADALFRLPMAAAESENLFQVALGDMEKDARDWSEKLALTFKADPVAIREQLGTFDLMFKGLGAGEKDALQMSEAMTKLAYDMSSLRNIPLDEAFMRLRSGLAGEVEPLRRFGVSIQEAQLKQWALKNGLDSNTQGWNEQQKVIARYAVILEQTQKDQGDLSRTLDSNANQARVFQAQWTMLLRTLGEDAQPTINRALIAVNDELPKIRKAWQDMGEAGRASVERIAITLAAGGPLLVGLDLARKAVIALKNELVALGKVKTVGALGIGGLAVAGVSAVEYGIKQATPEDTREERAKVFEAEAARNREMARKVREAGKPFGAVGGALSGLSAQYYEYQAQLAEEQAKAWRGGKPILEQIAGDKLKQLQEEHAAYAVEGGPAEWAAQATQKKAEADREGAEAARLNAEAQMAAANAFRVASDEAAAATARQASALSLLKGFASAGLDDIQSKISAAQDEMAAARDRLTFEMPQFLPGEYERQQSMGALDAQIAALKAGQQQKVVDRLNKRPAKTVGQQIRRLEAQKELENLQYQAQGYDNQRRALSLQQAAVEAERQAVEKAQKAKIDALEAERKKREEIVKQIDAQIEALDREAKLRDIGVLKPNEKLGPDGKAYSWDPATMTGSERDVIPSLEDIAGYRLPNINPSSVGSVTSTTNIGQVNIPITISSDKAASATDMEELAKLVWDEGEQRLKAIFQGAKAPSNTANSQLPGAR